MIVGVVGSRKLRTPELGRYLPQNVTKIVSGGARGIDSDAKQYAKDHGIPYAEYRPDYARYKRGAPLRRNLQIIESCDMVYAFWDGSSRGTEYTIRVCKKKNVPVLVFLIQPDGTFSLLP